MTTDDVRRAVYGILMMQEKMLDILEASMLVDNVADPDNTAEIDQSDLDYLEELMGMSPQKLLTDEKEDPAEYYWSSTDNIGQLLDETGPGSVHGPVMASVASVNLLGYILTSVLEVNGELMSIGDIACSDRKYWKELTKQYPAYELRNKWTHTFLCINWNKLAKEFFEEKKEQDEFIQNRMEEIKNGFLDTYPARQIFSSSSSKTTATDLTFLLKEKSGKFTTQNWAEDLKKKMKRHGKELKEFSKTAKKVKKITILD